MAEFVLIVAGALALAYGGFSYTTDTHDADIGPVHMSFDEKERVNIEAHATRGLPLLPKRRAHPLLSGAAHRPYAKLRITFTGDWEYSQIEPGG